MLRSLSSGVSGIQALQGEMDVISNNIANVNTTGFKSARVEFADSFSETLRASSDASGAASNLPAMQVGSGVMTSEIQNNYSQGALVRTSYQTDLAIDGEGFFIVRDPVSSEQFASRAGSSNEGRP